MQKQTNKQKIQKPDTWGNKPQLSNQQLSEQIRLLIMESFLSDNHANDAHHSI